MCERSNYWVRLTKLLTSEQVYRSTDRIVTQIFFPQIIIHFKKKYMFQLPSSCFLSVKQEILILKKIFFKYLLYIRYLCYPFIYPELVLRLQLWTRQTWTLYSRMQLWKDKQKKSTIIMLRTNFSKAEFSL